MDLQQSAFTRRFRPGEDAYGWDDVDVLTYKDDGTAPFRDITRQVLFEEAEQGVDSWPEAGRLVVRRYHDRDVGDQFGSHWHEFLSRSGATTMGAWEAEL